MSEAWRERMGHYRTPGGAEAYRNKHRGTLLRRIADGREKALLRRTLARLGPLDSILDCPCGAGRFLPGLAEHAASLWAVDQSRPLVALARQAPAEARFAVGDAGALPLADASVDALVCMRLLHHFPETEDRVRILTESRRVVHKGIVLSFADADTWRGARDRSRRKPLSRAQLGEEAARAGLELDPTVLSVNGLFSRFSFALLRVRQS